jgi:predicted metal-dependent phosphoesterase TrpH
MKFDLHIHSNYSDGRDEVKTILKAAVRRRLAGLSITDHDTLRGSEKARKIIKEQKLDLILIPGAEVTTAEGHLLVLGVSEIPPRGLSPEETTDLVHEQGGITIVPHPYHPFRHAIGRVPKCDAVEVYNSKHLFGIANARARREALRRGLPMVAGSDSHFAETVGLGVTDIDASDAKEAIEAIRAGRTRIIGKRTPPQFFIGNTVQSIFLIVRKGVGRRRKV